MASSPGIPPTRRETCHAIDVETISDPGVTRTRKSKGAVETWSYSGVGNRDNKIEFHLPTTTFFLSFFASVSSWQYYPFLESQSYKMVKQCGIQHVPDQTSEDATLEDIDLSSFLHKSLEMIFQLM